MANTTDLMITSLFDEEAIEFINKQTGLDFKRLTDGKRSGGPKISSFDAFGTCPKSLGDKKIKEVIEAFKKAPFMFPKYAILLINDDDENFEGIITFFFEYITPAYPSLSG